MSKTRQVILTASVSLLLLVCPAVAQTTAFTYQGKLTDSGNLANGQFDFQFKLFDTQTVGTGTQQGGDVNVASVTVTNGSFSVQLDFGACASCFSGATRFLEIAVKPTSSGTFTTLGPRQPITATPYAIRSQNAAMATVADGLSIACVNCVTSSQIASVSGSVVNGTIPVASVPAGSSNYIQNTTTQQAAANFNISGNGTAGGTLSGNVVNAATQYNLAGNRVLSVSGVGDFVSTNTFAGIGAGAATTPDASGFGSSNSFFGNTAGQTNTTGLLNAFFGYQTGFSNTTGSRNAFFGSEAGYLNTTGSDNAFFGYRAGFFNTTGVVNAFFGSQAGWVNTTGSQNAFFGRAAGGANTTGSQNAFFGSDAGFSNTTGSQNAFFGNQAGVNNTTGQRNTFIGWVTGFNNTPNPTGDNNTLLGYGARVDSGVSNATAIGAFATVSQSDSLVLGGGVTKVGIGTAAPVYRLDVIGGVRSLNNVSTHFVAETTGGTNSWAKYIMKTPNRQWAMGTSQNFSGDQLYIADETAGQIRMAIYPNGGDIVFTGNVFATSFIPTSDARLKQNISKLNYGLSEVLRLRPVSWRWKAHPESGEQLGLVAQEVEPVLPELVSTAKDAEQTKGLNYTGLIPVLVNAIKEQQQQLDQQRSHINQQQAEIETLQQQLRQVKQQTALIRQQQQEMAAIKRLLCASHRRAAICQAKALQ